MTIMSLWVYEGKSEVSEREEGNKDEKVGIEE